MDEDGARVWGSINSYCVFVLLMFSQIFANSLDSLLPPTPRRTSLQVAKSGTLENKCSRLRLYEGEGEGEGLSGNKSSLQKCSQDFFGTTEPQPRSSIPLPLPLPSIFRVLAIAFGLRTGGGATVAACRLNIQKLRCCVFFEDFAQL